MSDLIIVALIAAVPPTLVGLANAVVLLKVHSQSTKNGMSINKLELATNGMKAELLAATKAASHAEGMAAQRQEDKDASAQA